MIKLTKLNGADIYLNPDLMGNMEYNANTVVHMTSGEKIIIKETPQEVVNKVIEFKRKIFAEYRS